MSFMVNSYNLNYDGGLSSSITIRRNKAPLPPELKTYDFRVQSGWGSKTMNFPTSPEPGDLIVTGYKWGAVNLLVGGGAGPAPEIIMQSPDYTFRRGKIIEGGGTSYLFGIWSKVSDGTETSVTYSTTRGSNRGEGIFVVILRNATWYDSYFAGGAGGSSGSVDGPPGRLIIARGINSTPSPIGGGTPAIQQIASESYSGDDYSLGAAWDPEGTGDNIYTMPGQGSYAEEYSAVIAVGRSALE